MKHILQLREQEPRHHYYQIIELIQTREVSGSDEGGGREVGSRNQLDSGCTLKFIIALMVFTAGDGVRSPRA